VDEAAETVWSVFGGSVWSYRIRKLAEGKWAIEKWEYRRFEGIKNFILHGEPTWADPKSALYYRDFLVAEQADQLCAFAGVTAMRGTELTVSVARDGYGKTVHLWKNGEWQVLSPLSEPVYVECRGRLI